MTPISGSTEIQQAYAMSAAGQTTNATQKFDSVLKNINSSEISAVGAIVLPDDQFNQNYRIQGVEQKGQNKTPNQTITIDNTEFDFEAEDDSVASYNVTGQVNYMLSGFGLAGQGRGMIVDMYV